MVQPGEARELPVARVASLPRARIPPNLVPDDHLDDVVASDGEEEPAGGIDTDTRRVVQARGQRIRFRVRGGGPSR